MDKHHAVPYKWQNDLKQAFDAAINFLEKILSVDAAYFSAKLSILYWLIPSPSINTVQTVKILLNMLLLNTHFFPSRVSADVLIWAGIHITKITVCGKQKFETSYHCIIYVEVRTAETSSFLLSYVLDEQAN